MNIDRRLWNLGKGCYHWFGLAIVLSIASVAASIGLFGLAAMLMVRAALHPSFSELQLMIVGIRFFGISRSVLRYLDRYFSHDATFRLLEKLRGKFYQAIEPIFPAHFHRYRRGDLLQRMVQDIETLQVVFMQTRTVKVVALFTGTMFFLLTSLFFHATALIFAVGFLVCAIVLPYMAQVIYGRRQKCILPRHRLFSDAFCDFILGYSEITLYERKAERLAQLLRLDHDLSRDRRNLAVTMGGISSFSQTFYFLSAYGFLYFVLAGNGDPTMLSAIPAALVLAFLAAEEALNPLLPSSLRREDCREAGRRLMEILDAKPTISPQNQKLPMTGGYGLDCTDITFSYPEQTIPTLHRISFRVPENGKIAIVGPSGSGKSSIYSLLLRFYEFQEGKIHIGGEDVRKYSAESVRARFGWSSQTPDFFHGTILENLLLQEEDEEKLSWAADLMQTKSWIEGLPDRYDTCIGEYGAKLSAGQRKRIDLMRTLLKNAPIMLLDEPLHHLDPGNAERIWEGITNRIFGKTLLVISHRLLTMERFDQILVMQRGNLVQTGRHQELIEQDGLYRRMWLPQQKSCLR